jgi:transposase-like protein
MTHEEKNNVLQNVLQRLTDNGFDGITDVLATLLNKAMIIEREKYLSAGSYERTEERKGYANGFKPKGLKTRMGELNVSIPQVRGTEPFKPSALDWGQRSERALKLALAEMYIQGVSTRKVKKVMEKMCGFEVSSTQVSKASKELDIELEKWRNRPIGEVKALILDARYEKVRMDGAVVSCAVLIASGILKDGRRCVLGVSVAISEAEVHWRDFLISLKDRGLYGVKFIVSDDHEGLKNALKATFPGVAWQRCQFHLQRNAQSHITNKDLKDKVAADIRAIFNAPSQEEAQRLLELTIEKYKDKQSKLAFWMEENIPEGFAVFKLPESMRTRLRTSNMAENLNRQIKRRTRTAGLFPNEESLLRLVTAVVSEISDDWEAGKVYLNVKGMKL